MKKYFCRFAWSRFDRPAFIEEEIRIFDSLDVARAWGQAQYDAAKEVGEYVFYQFRTYEGILID